MLKHLIANVYTRTQTFGLLHKGIYMILQELHGAFSNQLTAPLHSETPSVEQGKLLAPP